jgi:hypothetical protein
MTSLYWFTLVLGSLTIEDLPPIPTGEVLRYTYPRELILYRFIAFDGSEDSFYASFNNGVLTGLTATKKIIL